MRVFVCVLIMLLTGRGWGAERPNVLVIMADDLGSGDLGCQGAKDLKTPAIDAIFARGMAFKNFRANCPVCSPTRAAFLSGCYPDRAGVPGVIRTHPENNWGCFHPPGPTLAEQFRAAGYRTALVGKWHLGLASPNLPNQRGFEIFHGFLGDMMDDYYTHLRHGRNYMRLNGQEIEPEGHATDLFTTWACGILRNTEADEPFFLVLAYNAPHDPIQPPPEWLEKVKARQPELSDQRAAIVALIEHMDAGVGRVMEALEESGQAEDTIVVFTSDNGGLLRRGASNGSLRAGKGTMYEGGLRVPTAILWPGHVAAGSASEFQAMTMDLYPTLLEAAGIKFDAAPLDGRSFLKTLQGGMQSPLRGSSYFVRREGGRFGGKTIEALIQGEWKLVWNDPFGPPELYNLDDDPQETRNRIQDKPKLAKRLREELMRHIQRGGAVPWQASGTSLTDQ